MRAARRGRRVRWAVLSVVVGLAGCAGERAATRAPGVNLSGYSAQFKAGYADGCASVGGALRRDEARFKTDASYARGWSDGYSICKR